MRRLAAHVAGQSTDRLRLDGYRAVDIPFQHLIESVRHGGRQGFVKGAGPPEIGLCHPPDPRADLEIADTGFTQCPIEIGKHEVEEFLCRVAAIDTAGPQSTHHEEHMQHEKLETAIDGIGNGMTAEEDGCASLSHDGVVEEMGALAETGAIEGASQCFPDDHVCRIDLPCLSWPQYVHEPVRSMKPTRLAIIAAPVIIATVLAACEPRVSRHGQVLDQETVAGIEPGVDHRTEVTRRLGTPSSRSLFGDETWFYISQYRTTSVLSLPETESQTVVAIAFDSSGIVEEVAMLTIEDGIVIDPVSSTTPTHGRDLGLLEQLLGNIGRFDSPGTTAQFPTP